MTRVYLDHAATTPMVPAAVEAMTRELGRAGNPSSLHGSGRAARKVVEEARERIAACLGAQPRELIFTSGATEADNLAIKGGFWSRAATGRRGVVTSAVEHHAVLDSVGWLEQAAGARVSWLPVAADGRVAVADVDRAVSAETAVVSLVWAVNEVGAVQPVAQMAELARRAGALAHSDAVQAVGPLPVDFAASGLDLLSLTAHKLGGPYGIGALLARREVSLTPLLHGGGQERDVRSGTVDVPAVAGFAAAVEAAVERRSAESPRLRTLRQRLTRAVGAAVPDAVVYGPAAEEDRLPGLVNVGFPGCSAEALLLLLDAAGIDAASGSACSAGVSAGSHVLLALGLTETEARSVLRFSLGHTSTVADVDALVAALPDVVTRARAAFAA